MNAIAGWDADVLLLIQEHLRTAAGDTLLTVWSDLGNGGAVWIAAALLLLLFPKTRKAGLLALVGMLLNLGLVNGILKPLVERDRPWLVVEGLRPLLTSSDPNSFPSGHTSAAFAFTAAVCCSVDRVWVRVLAVAAAALMGWSRLYVGVHFPTDVLAGAVFGTLCGLAAVWLYRRYFSRIADLHRKGK